MDHWISTFLLAAEEVPAAPGQPAAQPGAAPSSPFGGLTMILLPVMAIILFMQMGNNPRKQQERHLEALKNLKKNDPVVTIGGMRGQFVSLSEDGSEVTVQLADNIRIRFDASAIRIPQTPPAKA